MKVFEHTQKLTKKELKEWMNQSKLDADDILKSYNEDRLLIAISIFCEIDRLENESEPD